MKMQAIDRVGASKGRTRCSEHRPPLMSLPFAGHPIVPLPANASTAGPCDCEHGASARSQFDAPGAIAREYRFEASPVVSSISGNQLWAFPRVRETAQPTAVNLSGGWRVVPCPHVEWSPPSCVEDGHGLADHMTIMPGRVWRRDLWTARIVTGLAGVVLLGISIYLAFSERSAVALAPLGILGFFVALAMPIEWAARRFRIELGPTELVLHSWRKTHRIPLADIDRLELKGSKMRVHRHGQKRIRYKADVFDLLDLIHLKEALTGVPVQERTKGFEDLPREQKEAVQAVVRRHSREQWTIIAAALTLFLASHVVVAVTGVSKAGAFRAVGLGYLAGGAALLAAQFVRARQAKRPKWMMPAMLVFLGTGGLALAATESIGSAMRAFRYRTAESWGMDPIDAAPLVWLVFGILPLFLLSGGMIGTLFWFARRRERRWRELLIQAGATPGGADGALNLQIGHLKWSHARHAVLTAPMEGLRAGYHVEWDAVGRKWWPDPVSPVKEHLPDALLARLVASGFRGQLVAGPAGLRVIGPPPDKPQALRDTLHAAEEIGRWVRRHPTNERLRSA